MSPMCMCKHAKISHTHFKDPVVHVSVHWIIEKPNKCQSVPVKSTEVTVRNGFNVTQPPKKAKIKVLATDSLMVINYADTRFFPSVNQKFITLETHSFPKEHG